MQTIIQYLQSFYDSERKAQAPTMSLKSMKSLLHRLGNPQNAARTIHITGSKGKGSTATFIASILQEAGYHTALYTSPHLHSYCERIAFDLKPASEADFEKGLKAIEKAVKEEEEIGNGPFSTFGILTALFFYLTANRKPKPNIDWQIIEVGLGGTYDATNVFDQKDLAIITAISLEHTAILGKTNSEIARNKAGIITSNCTTILASQKDPSVQNTLQEICKEKKSNLIVANDSKDFKYSLRLLGDHQIKNATTAVAAVQALKDRGIAVSDQAIKDGLYKATLPGRFEIFETNGKTIILDGAHNQDSAQALSETIAKVFPNRKCIFILGVNQDKDIESIWQELKKTSKYLITTKSDNSRAMPPAEMIRRISEIDSSVQSTSCNTIAEALQIANSLPNQSNLICVTGSLYLVAEAREKTKSLEGKQN